LALSSRNVYLHPEERKAATVLSCALRAAANEIGSGVRDASHLQQTMHKVLASEPRARVDYAEIVDSETFEPVVRLGRRSYAVLAVHIGKTRLIDNLLIETDGEESRTEL